MEAAIIRQIYLGGLQRLVKYSNANKKDSIINLLNRHHKATQDKQIRELNVVQEQRFDSLCRKTSLSDCGGVFCELLCLEKILRRV